jgi:hypothetical protein
MARTDLYLIPVFSADAALLCVSRARICMAFLAVTEWIVEYLRIDYLYWTCEAVGQPSRP